MGGDELPFAGSLHPHVRQAIVIVVGFSGEHFLYYMVRVTQNWALPQSENGWRKTVAVRFMTRRDV